MEADLYCNDITIYHDILELKKIIDKKCLTECVKCFLFVDYLWDIILWHYCGLDHQMRPKKDKNVK